MAKFKTVLKVGQAEIVEKKSRFIAHAKQVRTEEEARVYIEEIKKKHWDARHNVFAYQIGLKNEIQRFSDDGEPQGTAGKPVLDVLAGEDIKNCVIVVTRYFGGTLLGTGGLVRAYGKSAKDALYDARIAEIDSFVEFGITCEYTFQGKIQYALLQCGYNIKDTIFTKNVKFVVFVEEEKEADFKKLMIDLTSGKVSIEAERSFVGAVTEEGVIEI